MDREIIWEEFSQNQFLYLKWVPLVGRLRPTVATTAAPVLPLCHPLLYNMSESITVIWEDEGKPSFSIKTVAGVSDKKGGTQKPNPNSNSYEGWRNSPGPAEPSKLLLASLQLPESTRVVPVQLSAHQNSCSDWKQTKCAWKLAPHALNKHTSSWVDCTVALKLLSWDLWKSGNHSFTMHPRKQNGNVSQHKAVVLALVP